MKKVNWGVLGGGRITKKVVPAMKNAENANYYAIASRSKTHYDFLERYGVLKTYDNYEELLNDPNVDCVYISLAAGQHFEWILKAIEKKKHILCEKPLALNSNQVMRIMEEAQKMDVLVMESYPFLYSPVIAKTKELLRTGVIGDIKYIHSMFSSTFIDDGSFRYDVNLGGGAAYDVGLFPITLILELMESPVTDIGAYTSIHKSGVDKSSTVNFRFKNGALASCYYSFDSFLKRDTHTIIGAEGIIELRAAFNQEGICAIILQTSEGYRQFEVDCKNNFQLIIEEMSSAILENKPIKTDLSFSLNMASIVETVLAKGNVSQLLTSKAFLEN